MMTLGKCGCVHGCCHSNASLLSAMSEYSLSRRLSSKQLNFALHDSFDESSNSLDTTSRCGTQAMQQQRLPTQPIAALDRRRSQPINFFATATTSVGVSKSSTFPIHTTTQTPAVSSTDPATHLAQSRTSARFHSPDDSVLARLVRRRVDGECDSPRSETASPALSNHSSNSEGTPETGDDAAFPAKVSIKIYIEDRSYHSIQVDASVTVADVLDQMIQKTMAKHDPAWAIVEHLGKYQLERSLEEHEHIYQIFKSWGSSNQDNRFYLRKEFNKYELFRNPNQYFPESMTVVELPKEDSSGLLTRYERYKNLLLQNLLSDETIPDIQGYVHIRESKRSWKKYFCLLRPSGLYYSIKGDSKEPRNLVLISHLDDVDIYSAQHAKKVVGAPTNFSFCLKVGDAGADCKSLKLFSCDSEQARLCWITSMRFVKYGTQLRENFKLMLRCDERLKNLENKVMSESGLEARNRVAMDFSGERGRVVSDPNEALSVAIEEGHAWRIRVARFPAGSTSSHDIVAGDDPSAVQRVPIITPAMLHLVHPWFHSGSTREDAEALIEKQGLADGVFLLRDSQSMPGVIVLSFAHNAKVKHCTIHKMEFNGQSFYTLDGGVTKFMDLIQLIDFYQLNAGALPTQLTHYVTTLL